MEVMSRSIVAGFDARKTAELASDELLKWGFSEEDVIVAVRDHDYAASGGAMIRSEEEDAISHLAHLIGLAGVPDEQSRALASRFDSMDAVVAVDANGRLDEARTILRDHGGVFEPSGSTDRAEWEEARHILQGHWERRADDSGHSWDQAREGYRYIYEKAIDPEFRGRTWNSAESELHSGFEGWLSEKGYQTHQSTWEWLKETLHELWIPATRGASPDDIVHPERLHRWIRLNRTGLVDGQTE